MNNKLLVLAQNIEYSSSGGEDAAAMGVLIVIVVISLVISLAVGIVICWLLSKIIASIPAEHRKVEPGGAWLMLIPCFNLYWVFVLFQRIPDSFKSYFDSVGRTDVADCGKQLGLWYAICVVCSIVPLLQYISSPAALVLLILLLVKWNGYKASMPAAAASAA